MTIIDFGQRVANRRSDLGYSVPELAKKARLDKTVIYDLEAGESKELYVQTFLKLMQALKWSAEEAVNAYLGKHKPTDSIKKDRVYQATMDFLEHLERAGVLKPEQLE